MSLVSQSIFGLLVTSSWVNTTTEGICDSLFDGHTARSQRFYSGMTVGVGCVGFSFLASVYLML
jgi:hypothetical protein